MTFVPNRALIVLRSPHVTPEGWILLFLAAHISTADRMVAKFKIIVRSSLFTVIRLYAGMANAAMTEMIAITTAISKIVNAVFPSIAAYLCINRRKAASPLIGISL